MRVKAIIAPGAVMLIFMKSVSRDLELRDDGSSPLCCAGFRARDAARVEWLSTRGLERISSSPFYTLLEAVFQSQI
jgi:hypothetical protein